MRLGVVDTAIDPEALGRLAAWLRIVPGLSGVREQAPVGPYTTWRVGGPADLLCIAESVLGLATAVEAARELGLSWRVLGRGSNVLVRDGGIVGLVIVNRSADLCLEPPLVVADGGLLLSTLARRAAAAGLAGLEWSAGIPGSVGGAIVSNAGAHGGEMKDTLRRVLLLEHGAQSQWVEAVALDLAYRHSRLRTGEGSDEIVLRAEFTLAPEAPEAIAARMREQKRQRKATQPTSQPTAGSVFKNPPEHSAARLIDQAGLKGLCVGGAQVSPLHANFMVAAATARAVDLLGLIDLVQARVRDRFGVELSLEVQLIGRDTASEA